jgi:hypothetical protein
LAVAAILLLLWLLARRKRRAVAAWQHDTAGALDAAHVSLSLVPASAQEITDVAHWQSVSHRVEQTALALDRSASTAPTEEGGAAARRTADSLRGLVFAVESERLLRAGTVAPTGDQLMQADAATRARRSDLDAALADLDRSVRPASPPPTGPSPGTTPTGS